MGNNHYNCPIVAYYGETLRGNMEDLRKANFLNPYLSLDGPGRWPGRCFASLHALDGSITRHEVFRAAKAAFAAYEAYKHALALEGERALDRAKAHGKRVMILAGRPYHIDPEICHGIDRLADVAGLCGGQRGQRVPPRAEGKCSRAGSMDVPHAAISCGSICGGKHR